jgi:hypothetical protein
MSGSDKKKGTEMQHERSKTMKRILVLDQLQAMHLRMALAEYLDRYPNDPDIDEIVKIVSLQLMRNRLQNPEGVLGLQEFREWIEHSQDESEENSEHQDEVGQAMRAYFEAIKSGRCPHCRQSIEQEEQRGRCVYARPCGHRLFQGKARKAAARGISTGDKSREDLKEGDRVRVKATCPPFTGRVGTLERITDTGDYLVDFGNDLKCGYDEDMLTKVEERE